MFRARDDRYVTINLFFSGYLIAYPDIPSGWIWYVHCNWLWYGWAALMKNQFSDSRGVAFSEDGSDIIDFFGLENAPGVWPCIGACAIFATVFFLLAWRALARDGAKAGA